MLRELHRSSWCRSCSSSSSSPPLLLLSLVVLLLTSARLLCSVVIYVFTVSSVYYLTTQRCYSAKLTDAAVSCISVRVYSTRLSVASVSCAMFFCFFFSDFCGINSMNRVDSDSLLPPPPPLTPPVNHPPLSLSLSSSLSVSLPLLHSGAVGNVKVCLSKEKENCNTAFFPVGGAVGVTLFTHDACKPRETNRI